MNIPTFEMIVQPKVSRMLLDDCLIRIDEWLLGVASEAFAVEESNISCLGIILRDNHEVF